MNNFNVIIKVSGSDPHKECYVTLTTKCRKRVAIEALDQVVDWSERPDTKEMHKNYRDIREMWINWDEKSNIPTYPPSEGPVMANFTEPEGDLLVVDAISSYYFHWFFIEGVQWDGTSDFTITVHEH
jgi:hypothetical protein